MACPMDSAELEKLKLFIEICSVQPQLLNQPQLEFFKNFVEKLGGKVPEGTATVGGAEAKPDESKMEEEPEKEDSDPESDVELNMEGCVEPDNDPEQPMGDASKEPSEEDEDKANELRSKAAEAYSEQNYEESVKLYTEAIELNPRSALYHGKRGQAYLKLSKPNACIRDCTRALEINPDSATAYKFRGRANRLLGKWEEAALDLRQACKLDYDEEADEWLKEVTPTAHRIEQHKLKMDRRRQEKELRERVERVRKAQEANRKAEEEKARADKERAENDPFAKFAPGNLRGPDLVNAFNDPEVAAALQDIMANPTNIIKYQNNPKVMNLVTSLSKEAAKGGFPGFGFPDPKDFPGPGEAGPGAETGPTGASGPKTTDDLD